jgi:hypothetical protein
MLLKGGHPNSLGRTLEAVEQVLAHPDALESLFQCYFSPDEVVRLRVSSAMKRICAVHPEWLVPYIDRLTTEIAAIRQASTQWTLAQLFEALYPYLSPQQRAAARRVMQRNLETWDDWIVLNRTMITLGAWARHDETLRAWLRPRVERLATDPRKSVANTARRTAQALGAG